MASTSMNIRTDIEIKKQAEELFATLGLNMTTAVNMFLRQSVRNQALPLELSINSNDAGFVYKGEGKKNLMDLVGKIEFSEDYDYKALRKGN